MEKLNLKNIEKLLQNNTNKNPIFQDAINTFLENIENVIYVVEGMNKISIDIDGEIKEIFVDKTPLNIEIGKFSDIEEINGVKYTINNSVLNEKKGIKILSGENEGNELFLKSVAKKELEKKGKRLPTEEELRVLIEMGILPNNTLSICKNDNSDIYDSGWSSDEEIEKKNKIIQEGGNLDYRILNNDIPHHEKSLKDFDTDNKFSIVFGIKDGITKNKINSEKSEDISDKYSIFGFNLDEKQKNIIDGFSPVFKKNMLDIGLKYNNQIVGQETIEINLDGEKIVFDKKQPVQNNMCWSDYIETINNLEGKKSLNRNLMKKLVKIFKGKAEVIGLDNNKDYWINDILEDNKIACGAYFNYGTVDYYYNLDALNYCICVND